MTDDENVVTRIGARLRGVASLVDSVAPVPPRRDWNESRVRPVAGVRVRGTRRARPALAAAFAVGAVAVVTIAFGISWGIRQNGSAQATGSPTPGVSRSEPSGSPTPPASLVASSQASGGTHWPLSAPCGRDEGYCLFAADGSLYVVADQIWAYDPAGHLRSGWPIAAPTGTGYDANGFAIAPDGSLLVAVPGGIVDITVSGKTHPGWPVPVANGICQLLVEPSGTIVAVEDDVASSEAWVYALTVSGSTPMLWSTRIAGDASNAFAASDGTIFLVGGGRGGGTALSTVGADGKLIAGWSTSVWNAMAVTPSGDLAVVAYDTQPTAAGMAAYNVLRTHVSVLDRNLKTVAGWPRVIDGPASAPAVGPDGAVYLLLGDTVATGSVLALDASGNTEPGWPFSLPDGYAGIPGDQSAGHTNVSQPLIVANGMVYVAASRSTGGQMIAAFKTIGSTHAGWTYRIPSDRRFAPMGYSSLGYPAVASATGTLFVMEQIDDSTGAVVAIGIDGQVSPGWPYVFSPGPLGSTVLADGGVGVWSKDFATRLTAAGSPSA